MVLGVRLLLLVRERYPYTVTEVSLVGICIVDSLSIRTIARRETIASASQKDGVCPKKVRRRGAWQNGVRDLSSSSPVNSEPELAVTRCCESDKAQKLT